MSAGAASDRSGVAIVTPFRHAGWYIGAMLLSVRGQTLLEWEHVFVDDGSADESLRLVREAADSDSRIKVF